MSGRARGKDRGDDVHITDGPHGDRGSGQGALFFCLGRLKFHHGIELSSTAASTDLIPAAEARVRRATATPPRSPVLGAALSRLLAANPTAESAVVDAGDPTAGHGSDSAKCPSEIDQEPAPPGLDHLDLEARPRVCSRWRDHRSPCREERRAWITFLRPRGQRVRPCRRASQVARSPTHDFARETQQR